MKEQGESGPPGDQQAEGAAWGHPLSPPGRSQGESGPLGGQQAEGAAWGHPLVPVLAVVGTGLIGGSFAAALRRGCWGSGAIRFRSSARATWA